MNDAPAISQSQSACGRNRQHVRHPDALSTIKATWLQTRRHARLDSCFYLDNGDDNGARVGNIMRNLTCSM
jgi:hypothetical protein